jgi:ribulose bisphosphate carboxylase small subunit
VATAAMNALMRIGDSATIATLTQQRPLYEGTATAQRIDQVLQELDTQSTVRSLLYQSFSITVEDRPEIRFTTPQLTIIGGVLAAMPPELIKGLHCIKTADPGLLYAGTYIDSVIELNIAQEFSSAIVVHEIGHFIDARQYAWKAFESFFSLSHNPEDFAYAEGQKNALEDFAATVENYVIDTPGEFSRALKQASAGNDVYLQKLLMIAETFSKGHPDHTIFYAIRDNEPIATKKVYVKNSGWKITALENTPIYSKNGKFNVKGLKAFFRTLEI